MTDKSERRLFTPAVTISAHLKLGVSISAVYIWSYFVTAYLVSPLQGLLFPSVTMSLLFVPHGVRMMSAWIYGWRSFFYLLPGALLCNLHFAGDRAFDPDILAGTMASLAAAPVAFMFVRKVLPSISTGIGQTRLYTLFGIGFLASLINLTLLRLAYGLKPLEGVVIFVGDTSGLLVSAMLLWLVLRLIPDRV